MAFIVENFFTQQYFLTSMQLIKKKKKKEKKAKIKQRKKQNKRHTMHTIQPSHTIYQTIHKGINFYVFST